MKKTAFYRCWRNVKCRCIYPYAVGYKNYGGRGITFCKKWETFQGFYEDMYSTYKEGLTIERIDPNGNYCPENCTWIPRSNQNDNTRKTVRFEYKGQTKTLKQWAVSFGINYNTLYNRLFTYGIPAEQAFKNTSLRTGKHLRKAILKLNKSGEVLKEYESIVSAEKDSGKDASTIWLALNGYTKTAGGFKWRYA